MVVVEQVELQICITRVCSGSSPCGSAGRSNIADMYHKGLGSDKISPGRKVHSGERDLRNFWQGAVISLIPTQRAEEI